VRRVASASLVVAMASCSGLFGHRVDLTVLNRDQREAQGQIRNGELADAPEFSGIGALLETTTHGLCSGTLITPSLVLTAAQCVQDSSPNPVFQFSAGTAQVAASTLVRQHPLFSTVDGLNLAFDMALVRLEKPISRGWDVQRFPVAKVNMPVDQHGVGVGFGESDYPTGVRTWGDFLLTQYIPGEGPVGVVFPDGFLETVPGSAKNQMICPGDSGGPLIYNNQIVGVASFRFVATCPEDGPGYFVSTPRLSKWIQDAVDELDPPGACAGEDNAGFATAGGGCHDLLLNKVWSAPGPTGLNQAAATSYCNNLEEGGRDDWRLATPEELAGLDGRLYPLVEVCEVPAGGDDDDDNGDDDKDGDKDDDKDGDKDHDGDKDDDKDDDKDGRRGGRHHGGHASNCDDDGDRHHNNRGRGHWQHGRGHGYGHHRGCDDTPAPVCTMVLDPAAGPPAMDGITGEMWSSGAGALGFGVTRDFTAHAQLTRGVDHLAQALCVRTNPPM